MRQRKFTVAELREKEIPKLVAFKTNNPCQTDFEEARRLMNSFYRLCGLAEKNLYLANTERTCNKRSTKASEEREEKWFKRLDAEFRKVYGLSLTYCGYAPSIVKEDPHGGVSEKITRYFYG